MALINFYKGLKENYSPDTHGNSIYSCTDTNECYILGVLYENISEEEITNKIGTNTYTGANYISKETNLTDAAMQLDEEIKATNDNIDILNAATVKSVKVGSNTSNEAFSSGVITIANATESSDGALSKEVYNSLSSFSYITSFGSAEESTSNLNYPIRLRNIANGTTSGNYLTIPVATTSNIGLMSKTDKTKLDNIESIYAKLTGDSFKNNNACWGGTKTTGETICLVFVDPNNNVKVGSPTTGLYLRSSSEAIYHEVQDGEDSQFHQILDEGNFKAGTNYVAPATLNNYLSLTGGTITGIVRHSANIDLDNGKYIEAYTTGGQLYPVLFIDSKDDFVVGSNSIETRIRSNDTDLIHDTTSGRYTIYDSHNLDINKWNVPQYTGDYNLIAKSGLTYWNHAAGEVSNIPASITNNNYGIMATFGNFDSGHIGESNVWGFQLGYGNYNSGTLYYRDFLGLTVSEWDLIVTSKNLLTKGIILDQGVGVCFQNRLTTNATGFLWIDKNVENVNQITDDDYVAGIGLLDGNYSDDGITTPKIFISCNSTKQPWANNNGLLLNTSTIEFNGKELAYKKDTALITIEVGTNLEANADRAALYTRIKNGNHNIRFLNGDYYCYPFQSTESLKSITFYYMLYSDGRTETRSVTINNDGSTINATY